MNVDDWVSKFAVMLVFAFSNDHYRFQEGLDVSLFDMGNVH